MFPLLSCSFGRKTFLSMLTERGAELQRPQDWACQETDLMNFSWLETCCIFLCSRTWVLRNDWKSLWCSLCLESTIKRRTLSSVVSDSFDDATALHCGSKGVYSSRSPEMWTFPFELPDNLNPGWSVRTACKDCSQGRFNTCSYKVRVSVYPYKNGSVEIFHA